jgi:hypothetical protein
MRKFENFLTKKTHKKNTGRLVHIGGSRKTLEQIQKIFTSLVYVVQSSISRALLYAFTKVCTISYLKWTKM